MINKDLQKDKTNELKKENKVIILFISILLVIASAVYIAYDFIPSTKNILNSKDENIKSEGIQLKTTSTFDKLSNGIFITDVSEVVENTMPSIVAITSKTLVKNGNFGPNFFNRNQYSEGAGSGIIIAQDDKRVMILTNNHVVSDATELSVQFINGKSFDANIVGTSERKDIAVISVDLKNIDNDTMNAIKIATIGNSEELKVGNGIIAIGNALGYGQSVTTGVISALDREVSINNYSNKMIQIDAAINGGNSGGALLNSKGEVVGINSAKYSSNAMSSSASIEGMGFAIPISKVSDLITSLMNGKEDESDITLGIEGYIITSNQSKNYNMPVGFYISNIVSGSSADKANLNIGDIITKINNKSVTQNSDIKDVLYDSKKGDKITLTIEYINGRRYQEKEVVVTLS